MKYRIIEEKCNSGHSKFVVQKKFIFWWNLHFEYDMDYDTCFPLIFGTLNEAVDYITKYKSGEIIQILKK